MGNISNTSMSSEAPPLDPPINPCCFFCFSSAIWLFTPNNNYYNKNMEWKISFHYKLYYKILWTLMEPIKTWSPIELPLPLTNPQTPPIIGVSITSQTIGWHPLNPLHTINCSGETGEEVNGFKMETYTSNTTVLKWTTRSAVAIMQCPNYCI